MRTLDRKLLRNLGTMRLQIAAIVLIIACGVASFVTLVTSYRGLQQSRDAYYGRYRMADLWAPVKRVPRSKLADLERIPGVRRVHGRISSEVILDMPRLPQPASGRMISVPARRRPILNDLHLTRGRWFTGDGIREVIVDQRFAEAHGLDVGDSLRAVMNNRKEALRITAIALCPEFVYLIGGAAQLLPDAERFTVLWISEPFAEAVFDYQDACNDVVATLERDANRDEVVERFDVALDSYGALGAYARKDQISNRFLGEEIKGAEGSATVIPTIFLAVAAFVLHVLMGRLVRTQRTQIAVFRAFGYTTRQLGIHFLKLALLVGVLGALLGCGLGIWFARGMLAMYQEFYTFPVMAVGLDPAVLLGGVVVSLAFATLGAWGAVRAVARIEPAEGMRPESPPVYHRTFFERFGGLWRRLGFAPRMILRHLTRTKMRALVTASGVSSATAILLLTLASRDAADVLMDTQYRLIERQDIQVGFYSERGRSALHELRLIDGVRTAEPVLNVPVKFVNGWRWRRTLITGIEQGQTLRALLDRDLRRVALPADGLLMSRKLAELLGLRVGEDVEVQVLTGRKQRFRARVSNVVDEYLGVFAYAEIGTLSRWIDERSILSGAVLSVDSDRLDTVGRTLKDMPAVASVTLTEASIKSFQETIAGSQNIIFGVLVLFAGVLTFGVMYNTARISLAERQRELGSMRVLGFTNAEVSSFLMGENMLLAVGALPLGLGLGAWLTWMLSRVYETDLYRFPFVLRPEAVLVTVAIVVSFGVVANLLVVWRLRRLDLVEVLKARE